MVVEGRDEIYEVHIEKERACVVLERVRVRKCFNHREKDLVCREGEVVRIRR